MYIPYFFTFPADLFRLNEHGGSPMFSASRSM